MYDAEIESSGQAAKLTEACGVFGIYGPQVEVARLTNYALYALQHRGQESAGLAVADGQEIKVHKGLGLVADVFPQQAFPNFKGQIAIGHVQHALAAKQVINAQPLLCRCLKGNLAICHNGCLVNTAELRKKLAKWGVVFQTELDLEIVVNLIARYGQGSLEDALLKAMHDLQGSYALLVMTSDKLIGIRDPWGNRPLCLGKLNGAYLLASESCALDVLGAEFVRDIAPGEIIVIDQNGLHSWHYKPAQERALCVFEFIYFARPDSNIDGINVMEARRAMGRELARESPVEADIVLPVPDSGIAGALGYAEALSLFFEMGLMKNRYIGRTFICPEEDKRNLAVRLKLNPVSKLIAGKRVAVVDDSIVRGTTSKRIVKALRSRGAKEVHILITSPPVIAPCYYGIDTSEKGKLIAAQKSVEEIRKYIGADSLSFLSMAGLYRALQAQSGFCTACLNEIYPLGKPVDK